MQIIPLCGVSGTREGFGLIAQTFPLCRMFGTRKTIRAIWLRWGAGLEFSIPPE